MLIAFAFAAFLGVGGLTEHRSIILAPSANLEQPLIDTHQAIAGPVIAPVDNRQCAQVDDFRNKEVALTPRTDNDSAAGRSLVEVRPLAGERGLNLTTAFLVRSILKNGRKTRPMYA